MIINDLFQLSGKNLAIAQHPSTDFMKIKPRLQETKQKNLSEHSHLWTLTLCPCHDVIENQVKYLEESQHGNKWGNFFEIGIYKSYFHFDIGGFKKTGKFNSNMI